MRYVIANFWWQKMKLKEPDFVKNCGWYVCTNLFPELYLRPDGSLQSCTGVSYGVNVGYWENKEEALIAKKKFEGVDMDITTGMLVETEDGELRLCVGNTLISFKEQGGVPIDECSYTKSAADKSYNIMAVYSQPSTPRGGYFGGSMRHFLDRKGFLDTATLLWKYEEEVKEMTMADLEFALGYKIKVIK